jgi:hypothetical protein
MRIVPRLDSWRDTLTKPVLRDVETWWLIDREESP